MPRSAVNRSLKQPTSTANTPRRLRSGDGFQNRWILSGILQRACREQPLAARGIEGLGGINCGLNFGSFVDPEMSWETKPLAWDIK